MSNVLEFPGLNRALKTARIKHKLTLTQAVCALRNDCDLVVAPNTLETWEYDRGPGVDPDLAESAYDKFAKDAEISRNLGKNLLFGTIPISSARDILDLNIEQMAELAGYKLSFWIKIEANSRFISDEKLEMIQGLLQEKFLQLCNNRA